MVFIVSSCYGKYSLAQQILPKEKLQSTKLVNSYSLEQLEKIAIELNKSGIVTMTKGLEPVAEEARKVLEASVKQEAGLSLEENQRLLMQRTHHTNEPHQPQPKSGGDVTP